MLLSVVSALARLSVDPWQEAAELGSIAENDGNSQIGIADRNVTR